MKLLLMLMCVVEIVILSSEIVACIYYYNHLIGQWKIAIIKPKGDCSQMYPRVNIGVNAGEYIILSPKFQKSSGNKKEH